MNNNSLPAINNKFETIDQVDSPQFDEPGVLSQEKIEEVIKMNKEQFRAQQVMDFYQKNHGGKKLKQSKTLKNLLK